MNHIIDLNAVRRDSGIFPQKSSPNPACFGSPLNPNCLPKKHLSKIRFYPRHMRYDPVRMRYHPVSMRYDPALNRFQPESIRCDPQSSAPPRHNAENLLAFLSKIWNSTC